MTVGRNGGKSMTDQVWADPGHGTVSADSPWAEVELDPETPTMAAPGSMEKVMMLQARYAAGVPLWDKRDSSDHGQRQPATALSAKALNESVGKVESLEI